MIEWIKRKFWMFIPAYTINVKGVVMDFKLKRKDDGSFSLQVDGEEAKRIGKGRDRTVFKIPGVNLVAKVDNGYQSQADTEWGNYKKIRGTKAAKHVARLYKPVSVKASNGSTYKITLQKLVKGATMDSGKFKSEQDWSTIRKTFEDEFGIGDLHSENVMITRKGKIKIVDMGI